MINKILEIKFGSHLYGTNTEQSDLDLKAIYLPTAKQIVLNSYNRTIAKTRSKEQNERNNKDDIDIEILSLDRFVDLLLQGQTMAIDMLFANKSDYTFYTKDGLAIINYIKTNRNKFLNKNINAFVGYSKTQAAKYGQKGFRLHAIKETLKLFMENLNPVTRMDELNENIIPNWIASVKNDHIKIVELDGPNGTKIKHLDVAGKYYPFTAQIKTLRPLIQKRFDQYGQRAILAEKNEGIDWKALSHAVRVNYEAYELLTTGNVTFPRPEKEILLKIKKGEIHYNNVAELIETGLENLTNAMKISKLNEKADIDFANEMVYNIYRDIVIKG